MSRATIESEMLSRLGLPQQAGPEEVEAAYSDLVAFLESAPHELRDWSRAQIAAADEAYALLSDPSASIASAPEAPAEVEPKPTKRRPSAQSAKRATIVAAAPPPSRRRRLGPLARAAIGSIAVMGVLAAGYAVYASDKPAVPGLSGTPAPESSAAALDTARIATLMETIQADPNDTVALQQLADIYFTAGDYASSGDFENKVLAIKPDDVTAHLAIGAAAYNLGSSADAETHWRRVLELDPLNVEAHYDLGFMYFSSEPPDVPKTIAEWQQVVDIAPDTQIAQTVSTHLQTLEQWQSSASPTTSSAPGTVLPTASVAPVASAAPAAATPAAPASAAP